MAASALTSARSYQAASILGALVATIPSYVLGAVLETTPVFPFIVLGPTFASFGRAIVRHPSMNPVSPMSAEQRPVMRLGHLWSGAISPLCWLIILLLSDVPAYVLAIGLPALLAAQFWHLAVMGVIREQIWERMGWPDRGHSISGKPLGQWIMGHQGISMVPGTLATMTLPPGIFLLAT
jgi:hypothetical protein